MGCSVGKGMVEVVVGTLEVKGGCSYSGGIIPELFNGGTG